MLTQVSKSIKTYRESIKKYQNIDENYPIETKCSNRIFVKTDPPRLFFEGRDHFCQNNAPINH